MNAEPTPREVTVRAPAKVNLQLAVGPVHEDGYHPLATVFQAVDLYELVTARSREDGRFTVTTGSGNGIDVSGVPADDSNLAIRAARAVAEAYGLDEGADLTVVKGIPVAGGMAGGSADAAAALVACAELWETGASRQELADIAATLGSDVPFALAGHTAVGLGRGDRLSPAMTHGTFHWVFATQRLGLSTRAVYEEFDAYSANLVFPMGDPIISDFVMQALIAGDPNALGAALINDLQVPAIGLAPHLQDVIDAAVAADACGAIVSGSGPTVAALARNAQHALAIAAHLRALGVADQVITASGPAPGATVLA
ncbi:4-(cytidine 5'-diphospho)-2-C-methyl-D-erythritol kinase [Demequina sp.]|uniref:4-(cytidine 5'-diphospho)-2-C-methyl-D-erythritol kinase n=1 Tax=Demequina sp. TaxID=2050685 RepID=UPI003D0B2012